MRVSGIPNIVATINCGGGSSTASAHIHDNAIHDNAKHPVHTTNATLATDGESNYGARQTREHQFGPFIQGEKTR